MKNKTFIFLVIKGKISVKMKTIPIYFFTYFYKHDTKDPIVELEEPFRNI